MFSPSRDEAQQEQLWEISINIVKDYLSPEVFEKYGATLATGAPSEQADQSGPPQNKLTNQVPPRNKLTNQMNRRQRVVLMHKLIIQRAQVDMVMTRMLKSRNIHNLLISKEW